MAKPHSEVWVHSFSSVVQQNCRLDKIDALLRVGIGGLKHTWEFHDSLRGMFLFIDVASWPPQPSQRQRIKNDMAL